MFSASLPAGRQVCALAGGKSMAKRYLQVREMTENVQKRVLAIDYGERRIGLALSIPEMNFAKPLKTVDRENAWDELDNIFAEYMIGTVVIGLPIRTDGRDGESVPAIKQFAAELRDKFNVAVKFWDERFTTRSAEQLLRTLGKQPSRDKGLVDKIAAAMILEEYLSTL
jgi:putative Holliday junction resolvase